MKKSFKFLAVAMAAASMAAPMAACNIGGTATQSVDESKTQIYAYAVNNGLGYKWMEHFAEEFNKLPGNEAYQVVPQTGDMDLTTTLSNRLSAKSTEVNIYFGCQSALKNMILENKLIDLTSVYNSKVDGDSNGTIADKTHNYAQVKQAWSDLNGNGIYGVPYGTGVSGMVFDFDWFLENDLLNFASADDLDEVNDQAGKTVCRVDGDRLKVTVEFGNYLTGDYVLTKGRDGKYGTYDDGQVTYVSEFESLLQDIMAIDNTHPFLYCTKSFAAYTPTLPSAAMMQEMGYDNYIAYNNFDGELKNKDGSVEMTLTPATGTQAFQSNIVRAGLTRSAEVAKEYIWGQIGSINGQSYSASQMVHGASLNTTSLSHTDAQDKFVSARFNPESIKVGAFLIEGVWFEGSEALGTINALSEQPGRGQYAYGTRRFRYYLTPWTTTQISDKTVMALQDDGSGVILNNVPQKVKDQGQAAVDAYLEKCKEFLAFTLKNENLAYYTETMGIPRPYDYTVDKSKLPTPFTVATYEMCADTENIQMYRTGVVGQSSLIRSYGAFTLETGNIEKDGTVASYSLLNAFKSTVESKRLTVAEYVNACMTNGPAQYTTAYNKVKDYIK